tara:strand:+ start:1406 stop:1705 length:300 start_codon:yes stop_codon:yes gene_type:complete
MCLSPEYCPEDNVTYPCMECKECVEEYLIDESDEESTDKSDEEEDEKEPVYTGFFPAYSINEAIELLKSKFGNVKSFPENHGKHRLKRNYQETADALPF